MLIKDGTRKGRMKKDSLYVVLKVHKTKYSSLAQSVEHSAVNRRVVGSNPTRGAKSFKRGSFLMTGMRAYSSAG